MNPKNIFMIDRNMMVDRRIVLEAKLLRQQGHRVVLAAAYGVLGDNEAEIDGLPILRFNESAAAQYGPEPTATHFDELGKAPEPIVLLEMELEGALDALSRRRFDAVLGGLRRVLGRHLALPVAAIAGSRYFSKRIIAAQRISPATKVVSVAALAILSLNLRLFGLIPTLWRERGALQAQSTRVHIADLEFQISRHYAERSGLGELARRLRFPRYGLDQLRRGGHPLRWLAGVPLALLTLDPYVIRHLGKFATGRFPFMASRADYLKALPEPLLRHLDKQPLDAWEASVIRFALALDRVDVVHAHDLPALRVAAVIARLRKIALVYDAHELYSYQPGIFGERKRRLFDTEHALIGFCDEIVVINADQAAVMRRDHGPGSYTPLTNATEQPPEFDIQQRYRVVHDYIGLPEDARTMLFMGGINRARKIHLLLEGAALAKQEVHLVFLTWGMEIPEFRQLAADLKIADRVHFLDPVPWSEIVFWAASVDVGVMPYQALDLNTRISSPNKMYEFIAAGTPMIGSSELVNVRRVVGKEGFGVLLPFHKAEDYARAIDTIFDPALGGPERFRPALVEKAHKYLWDAEAQEFAQMYERLLAEDRVPKARTE
jgi:glycosyltransferase involved in cell wall biosynthesis